MSKSLKCIATAAVVLSILLFSVFGLMAGSSCTDSQLDSDFHVYEPTGPQGERAAGSLSAVEEVDLRSWVYTWGSSPVPPPPIPTTK